MAFEDIEAVGPVRGLDGVPPDGVRVRAMRVGGRGHSVTPYIQVKIGARLAGKIGLTGPHQPVRLLFGTGADAGRIKLALDCANGKFLARRDKNGNYALSINAATADGLFALEFTVFVVIDAEVGTERSGSAFCVFQASDEMLAVAD